MIFESKVRGLKACLITGATSGIGRAAALELARQGGRLFLVGRNESRGSKVATACRHRGSPQAEFIKADIGSQAQVRRLAQAIHDKVEQLDVLILNAGARFDHFEETEDGIERTFAINHLGHFLLAALLLDRLLAAPAARIVVTGSIAHRHVDAQGEWCLKKSGWNKRAAYGKSKLANIVFSRELGRRLAETSVTVNAADPGTPLTRFARNNGWMSWLKHLVYHLTRRELGSARHSGQLLAKLATDDSYASQTGKYFSINGPMTPSEAARDPGAAADLWDLSLSLTGIDEQIGLAWKHFRALTEKMVR